MAQGPRSLERTGIRRDMAEYKSSVKKVFAPQQRVYDKLQDLQNLAVIQQNLDNTDLQQRILEQAGDKVSPEQLGQIIEKLRSLTFDKDSVSGESPIGNITLRIIEREEPKTIKFALEGAPINANLWVQILPAGENEAAMRLTLKAELNFFIKQMVGKKLEQGVEGLAQMLASIPY